MKGRTHLIKTFSMILLSFFVFSSAGFPDDEEKQTEQPEQKVTLKPIVVTATKTEQSIEEVASSVTVVSSQDIDNSKNMTAAEALRKVPGLDITSQGGLGRNTSVFIRGARSEDTLVMIDGMEINDPITPARTFNFADLLTDNIDRIEVVRGPQSTLYGSDTIGGVVNIITRKGSGPPKFSLLTEGGSMKTFREVLGGDGKIGKWDYSFSGTRLDSGGVSSANAAYHDNAFSGRLGYQLFEKGKVDFVFRSVDAKVHLDDWDFTNLCTIKDPNFIMITSSQVYQLRYTQQLTDSWDSIVKAGYFNSYRGDTDKPDPHEPSYFSRDWYDGSIFKTDWQNNWHIQDIDIITAGFEYQEEKGESLYFDNTPPPWGGTSRFPEKSAHNLAYYAQNQLTLFECLFLTGGVRLDDHSAFGTNTTYKGTLAYIFRPTGTKFKGTWGTGFKAPSLSQLYAPANPSLWFGGGNPNLKPEKSKSFDLGVEQHLLDEKVFISFVYFHNDYDKYITYYNDPITSLGTYKNLSKAQAKGFEVELGINPSEKLTLSANYTRTDTRDKTKGGQLLPYYGGQLLRCPRNKAGMVVNYIFQKKLQLNLSLNYVGKRVDWQKYDYLTNTYQSIFGNQYGLVNLAGSYTINEHVQLFTRIENLFNRNYQEIKGYDTPGISAFGGVKLSF